jgi:hypothetical protein
LLKYRRLIAVMLFLAILFAVVRLTGLNEHFTLASLQQKHPRQPAGRPAGFRPAVCAGQPDPDSRLAVPRGGRAHARARPRRRRHLRRRQHLLRGDLSHHPFRRRRRACASSTTGSRAYLLGRLDFRPIVSIVLLRMAFQTVPALNYALAMSGVRFRSYLIGTLLGLPLPILLYCLFFDYLAKALKLV